eukprot:386874-Rhodomonas_salina.1
MKVLIQGGLDGYVSVTSQSRTQRLPTRTEGSNADLAKCGYDLEGASRDNALDQNETQKKENPDPEYPPMDLASQTSSTK